MQGILIRGQTRGGKLYSQSECLVGVASARNYCSSLRGTSSGCQNEKQKKKHCGLLSLEKDRLIKWKREGEQGETSESRGESYIKRVMLKKGSMDMHIA